MVSGRARRLSLLFLICVAIPAWAEAGSPSSARAESLEGVTGAVEEVVETVTKPVEEAVPQAPAAPVQEVTEAVTPPVQEVTEAATAPVEAVTKEVPPPVKAAAETVTRPPPVIHEPQSSPPPRSSPSPTKAVTGTVGGAVSSVGGTAHHDERAEEPSQEAVGEVNEGARPSSAPSAGDRTGRPRGAVFIPPPTKDGATRAPMPRWVSYIWPAIALARPGLVELVGRLEEAVRVVLAASAGWSHQVAGAGPVVAGVHASGGHAASTDGSSAASPPSRSSSPFSEITSAVGDFPYDLVGAVLGYLLIVTIMVIAIIVAVRWEMAHDQRKDR
jgi:hypothetical protein